MLFAFVSSPYSDVIFKSVSHMSCSEIMLEIDLKYTVFNDKVTKWGMFLVTDCKSKLLRKNMHSCDMTHIIISHCRRSLLPPAHFCSHPISLTSTTIYVFEM